MTEQDNFIEVVMGKLGLTRDKHLADRLGLDPANICNIRNGRLKIGPTLLINVHEETGMSIKELKQLAGMEKA